MMPLTTELVIFHLILYPKFTLCLSFCGLPHRLSHTGSLLVGFRLGSAGEQWSGIKKRGWRIPPLLLSVLVTFRGCIPLGPQLHWVALPMTPIALQPEMITTSHFAKLWVPQHFQLVLLTLPILVLKDYSFQGMLWLSYQDPD